MPSGALSRNCSRQNCGFNASPGSLGSYDSGAGTLRFYLTFAFLTGLALFLLLTSWHEVQKVFGL